MSRLFKCQNLLVILSSSFLILISTQFAYSQCDLLCMNQHGYNSASNGITFKENEYGLSTGQFYETAIEDTGYTGADAADENLLAAADDNRIDTTYIEAPSNKWQFSVIPYLWLMGINGKTTIKGRTADLNVSFGDIWDNLDFATEIHIEAWKERYGFFIDTSYAKIALKKDVELRLDKTLNTKFVTKFFLGEIGGFYRVGTWPLGRGTTGYQKKTNTSITFDAIGGGRYWYLKNTLNLNGPLDILPSTISDSQNWFDFFAGGRVNLAINKFFVQVRSDIGGFGLGFSSDFAWNIAGYVGYELPWYHITPIIGYRALYDKYKNGSGDNRFVWDAWISGPQIGIGIKF